MSKKLRAWQCVRNAASIRNLPPYTYIYRDDQNPPHIEQFICPDVGAAIEAIHAGSLVWYSQAPAGYRGLCLDIINRDTTGDTVLLYAFKNGSTREIWSIV